MGCEGLLEESSQVRTACPWVWGAPRLLEGRGLEAAWRLPQEATPTAFGLAEMRSSTFTGEALSLASSAVPVGWTGAVWTLPCTATVMQTSHSGEGTGGQGSQDSLGPAERQG